MSGSGDIASMFESLVGPLGPVSVESNDGVQAQILLSPPIDVAREVLTAAATLRNDQRYDPEDIHIEAADLLSRILQDQQAFAYLAEQLRDSRHQRVVLAAFALAGDSKAEAVIVDAIRARQHASWSEDELLSVVSVLGAATSPEAAAALSVLQHDDRWSPTLREELATARETGGPHLSI